MFELDDWQKITEQSSGFKWPSLEQTAGFTHAFVTLIMAVCLPAIIVKSG
jgi:hypothetical protein